MSMPKISKAFVEMSGYGGGVRKLIIWLDSGKVLGVNLEGDVLDVAFALSKLAEQCYDYSRGFRDE